VGTTVLLASAIAVTAIASKRIEEPIAVPLSGIPPVLAGWKSVAEESLADGVLKQLAPTEYLSRRYRKGDADLGLFIAYYAQQRAGESMHSPKHCLPGAGWEIWKQDTALIPVNGAQVRINKHHIHNSGTRMLMYYWYQSRSGIIANEYVAKLLLARDTLLTGRTAGSIVRMTMADTPHSADEAVVFASHVIEEVRRCFGPEDSKGPNQPTAAMARGR
jgi:EpsI family protein